MNDDRRDDDNPSMGVSFDEAAQNIKAIHKAHAARIRASEDPAGTRKRFTVEDGEKIATLYLMRRPCDRPRCVRKSDDAGSSTPACDGQVCGRPSSATLGLWLADAVSLVDQMRRGAASLNTGSGRRRDLEAAASHARSLRRQIGSINLAKVAPFWDSYRMPIPESAAPRPDAEETDAPGTPAGMMISQTPLALFEFGLLLDLLERFEQVFTAGSRAAKLPAHHPGHGDPIRFAVERAAYIWIGALGRPPGLGRKAGGFYAMVSDLYGTGTGLFDERALYTVIRDVVPKLRARFRSDAPGDADQAAPL